MLKECYSSIKRVLKEALSRMANTARRNLEKQTRLAVPVRTMLIVTLFVQLLCLGEPCAQAGDRVKARTAIGNSIDFRTPTFRNGHRFATPKPTTRTTSYSLKWRTPTMDRPAN